MTTDAGLLVRPSALPLLHRLLVGLLLAVVGCKGGDSAHPTEPSVEPPGDVCTDDTGRVIVTVGAGIQPVFDWEPACPVAMLLVEEGASDRWSIWIDDDTWNDPLQANLITPPVTYGVPPAGVTVGEPPAAIVSGVTYELILWRAITAGSTAECIRRFDNGCLIAVHEFTPAALPNQLTVTTTSLSDGVQNVDYGIETLMAAGGNGSYYWALASGSSLLPPGLHLAANGEITGTPTVPGVFDFAVEVASGSQTARRALAITVLPTAPVVLQPSDLCSDHASYDIASFGDANLEAAVRVALSIGAQDVLTCGVISGLTSLTTPAAGIGSIAGMQNLTSLTALQLQSNSITDISALSGLTSLEVLRLDNNSISDISALSGLTSLEVVHLYYNSITKHQRSGRAYEPGDRIPQPQPEPQRHPAAAGEHGAWSG